MSEPVNFWNARGVAYAGSFVHRHGPSLPKLLALARPNRRDRCLDIGTGAGHTAAAMATFAGDVVGLDLAAGMVQAARESYGSVTNLKFMEADAANTGLEPQSFDIITARHTLHHHPDIRATLREVHRLLKPAGRFVLVDEVTPEPKVFCWYDTLERTRDPAHVRAYTLQAWQEMLTEAALLWTVGDIATRYPTDIHAWVARLDDSAAQHAKVQALFAAADEEARALFNIRYHNGSATTFDMPMLIALSVKPG